MGNSLDNGLEGKHICYFEFVLLLVLLRSSSRFPVDEKLDLTLGIQ